MTLNLVYVYVCDVCDDSAPDMFDTEAEAKLWAEANGWEDGPDDFDHVCPRCADDLAESVE